MLVLQVTIVSLITVAHAYRHNTVKGMINLQSITILKCLPFPYTRYLYFFPKEKHLTKYLTSAE